MFKPVLTALSLLCALPASATTVAEFSASLDISLQSTLGEWLIVSGGFLPGSESISQTGDVTLVTGDEGGGAACCFTGGINSTAVTDIGMMAFNATGSVNAAPGEVFAEGENRAGFSISNQGGAAETVTLTFNIAQSISQIVSALVGGAAASGTELTIQHNGSTIYNHALLSMTDGAPMSESFGDLFEYTFDLPAFGATTSNFIISMTGGVHASSNAADVSLSYAAPVPLPAGGLLLIAGLGGLVAVGRRSRA